MLRPVFGRSWNSSHFRPSAQLFEKNGVMEEQKSPSELAWGGVGARGVGRCWEPSVHNLDPS